MIVKSQQSVEQLYKRIQVTFSYTLHGQIFIVTISALTCNVNCRMKANVAEDMLACESPQCIALEVFMDLGADFSIHVASRRVDAVFWLSIHALLGAMQCIIVGKNPSIVGKNPSIVENDLILELKFSFTL
jgi:hypothetical protein